MGLSGSFTTVSSFLSARTVTARSFFSVTFLMRALCAASRPPQYDCDSMARKRCNNTPCMPVLAHLLSRFRDKPENVATAALFHILQTSAAARTGMLRLLAGLGGHTLDVKYACQERTENAGQPDLVGRDESGNVVLVVEAKFWAGFTANQPVEYLQHIYPSGLLLFISPEVRLQELWSQLLLRVRSHGLTSEPQQGLERIAKVSDRTLALVSWRRMLSALMESVNAVGDGPAQSDLQQLSGLCDQMDTEAFFPLREEELSDVAHAKRSLHYSELIDAIADQAKRSSICRKLRPSASSGYYGVDLRFGDLQMYLGYTPYYWAKWGITPIWLQSNFTWAPNKQFDPNERTKIKAAFSIADPTGAPLREDDSAFFIPIWLQTGVSKEEIVEYAVQQLKRVGTSLAQSTGNAIRFSYVDGVG